MTLPRELSVNLALPATPLVDDPKLAVEIQRVYNSIRALARALDSYTGVLSESDDVWEALGTSRIFAGKNSHFYPVAGVDLSYGETVKIDGSALAQLGTDGAVIGFCSAPNGTVAGETTEVQVFGLYPSFPAGTLTPGTFYVQSGTPGLIGTVGTQKIGFAISDTQLFFMPQL